GPWWVGPDGSRGLGGKHPADYVYGGQMLLDRPGEDVILVEGEPATDALIGLEGLECLVTGTVTGAGTVQAPKAISAKAARHYAGRRVFLWGDADASGVGAAHMNANADVLAAAGVGELRVVTWPGAPDHGDAADFVAAGGTADGVRELLDAAVPIAPEPAASSGASPSGDSRQYWGGRGGAREDSAATEIVELAHAAGVELFSFDDDAYATVRLPGPVPTEAVLRHHGRALTCVSSLAVPDLLRAQGEGSGG
ncbi:hypothetical protein B1B_05200, partial [mine drainage metagenome]